MFSTRLLRIFSLIAFATLLLCVIPEAHAQKKRRNVLYLNSYHNGYSWSDNILTGIKETLEASDYSIVLQVEYMDSKKFHYDDTVQTLITLYRDKFKDKSFDVILVSDNIAFDFIRKYGQQLFPNVPIVFCGVNDFKPHMLSNDNMTGVVEKFDVAANIALALRLHTSMKRMVVIGDKSVTVQAIRRQITQALPNFENKLEVEFWTDYALDEMLARIRKVKNDTFFYFIPMYRDIGGQFYSAQELLQQVRANTHAPLYSNWSFLLGDGIVGGRLLSGRKHGNAAANMALQVLNGTPAKDLPIVKHNDEPWMFDYNELKRLHISERALPENATVINAPSRFYELNKQVFWTIIVSLVILTIILVLLVMNIMEKRSVEQKIKDQLSFLRLLMDTIPIPIYSKDKYGRYQECNVAFEQFFHIKRADILNRNEWQLPGQSIELLHDSMDNKLLRSPGVEIYEQIVPDREGTPHNIIMHKATNLNTRGDIAGLVGVVFDFTDRKKAEDSLRTAEEKYRSIFENSPLGIFRVKPDGGIVDVNPALARMGGYWTPQGMIEDMQGFPDVFIDEMELHGGNEEEVVTFERNFKRLDSSIVTANITIRVIRDRLGNVELLEGFAENVTKRKTAEKALRESQQMLQLVLDNIPQLVSWKDKGLRYLGANSSFSNFFGLSDADSLIGKSDEELLPYAEDAIALQSAEAEVLNTDIPVYQAKCSIQSHDANDVWLEVNRVPLHDENKNVVGILTTAEDVTQKISLERQLLQSQKMEAIGTLAGGISHDFNNILTSIINSIELALPDLEENSLTWKDASRALRAAQRGSRLVKQILTFSRPSMAGLEPTNINEVLQETLGLLKASVPRNIEVLQNLPNSPSITRADPTQIHQVVMNLCTNSFQALRETGGYMAVRLDKVRVVDDDAHFLDVAQGNYFIITVEDNGPGIPSEILDKIFDPFFTTKGKKDGTGLGLAVVHGIIKAHKGGIRVGSTPFSRTYFEIYLPCIDEIEETIEVNLEEAPFGEGHILFVEDDEDQIQTIPRVIETLGYTVTAVNNPIEALRILREDHHRWDLVITDFDMPEFNGLELAYDVGEFAPDLPLIIVSGRDVASRGATSIPGIKAVLNKPYNKTSLAEAISSVLR